MSTIPLPDSWARMFAAPVSKDTTQKDRTRTVRGTPSPSKSTSIAPVEPLPRPGNRPYGLTSTELAVLSCLAEGATNREIAIRQCCEVGTVKVHVGRIFRKLGVPNRGRAILVAQTIENVRDVRIERACSEPFRLEWILAQMRAETKPEGVMVFRRWETADALYFLQRGRIHLPELDRTLSEGSLFGEVGVFSDWRRRSASAYASTPLRLFRVDADVARGLCMENPSFALHLAGLLAGRLATAAPPPDLPRPEPDGETGSCRDGVLPPRPECLVAGRS